MSYNVNLDRPFSDKFFPGPPFVIPGIEHSYQSICKVIAITPS